ncbi:MAG: ATP synthase F1 subunit gamma [Pseudomonadota bacterium]|nr:ATP synthase F1 subunit gamma [Pseudomonadota bacterium]MEC8461188.1 ATP synthase F1 subunit gamma [Pseudomonadota bacterium]
MSKLIHIRKKLATTQEVGRVTNAMQLVSASRFHQSFIKMKKSRPFVSSIVDMLASLDHGAMSDLNHPYLTTTNKARKPGIIVVGTQKGLCGSLNQRLVKFVLSQAWYRAGEGPLFWSYGEKMRHVLDAVGIKVAGYCNEEVGGENFFEVLFDAMSQYRDGSINRLYVCYNTYVSAMVQEPQTVQLLPVPMMQEQNKQAGQLNHLFLTEPSLYDVVEWLITQFLRSVFYQAVLEGCASEHAARMVAMKTATDNANRVVEQTMLLYNNVRQSLITSELIDIVSGSEAV